MKGSRQLAAVVACLLLPAAGLAQDAPSGAPAAAAPAPAAAPAVAPSPAPDVARQAKPAQVAAAPAAQAAAGEADARRSGDQVLPVVARAFYATLIHRDAEALSALCRPPFFFESAAANSPEEIKERWSAALLSKNFESARLYDVALFTPEELAAKYGKPPERLAAWPLKGSMISVGNVDGHPLLVLWKRSGTSWAAVAFHD